MKAKKASQIEFSSVLFDTLFGLILFFSIDSLLEVKGFWPFAFYLFSMVILIHWWLIFKSADDCFGEEVTESAADISFGIIYLILIDYVVLLSRSFDYSKATIFLIALFAIDLIWALVWLYVGEWQTRDKQKILSMERELGRNIRLNILFISVFASLFALGGFFGFASYVMLFVISYLAYIALTFYYKIIDIEIF